MANKITAIIVLAPLRAYSNFLSYYFPPRCRFYPSCSHYTYEAIETHGMCKGLLLGINRLLKCHPWHPGGSDPVPQKNTLVCDCKNHKLPYQSNQPEETI